MKTFNCPAWTRLEAHYHALQPLSLRKLFEDMPNRFNAFSAETADLFIDYSKNRITSETINLLCDLARERNVSHAISDLFSGGNVNHTENRPALHIALRYPKGKKLIVRNTDLICDVHAELKKMEAFADQLHQKKLLGFSGKPIDTILHVGMGGSGLGPALYYHAMNTADRKATCYFLTEFDSSVIHTQLKQCNPETTIAIIASKSFTTDETLTIFHTIQKWLCHAAGDAQTIRQHFFAVTADTHRAHTHNIAEDHILKIWDWVGGRFSIWSAVSFSMILVFGIKHFQRFLNGAHKMDLHFLDTPLEKNMPVIMALLSIWYNNFFHAHTKVIVPYSAHLNLLPAYLQQLHMESLGKNINVHGEKIQYATGNVIWGDIGPNSQHSFHQLLMQGSHLIPVDFILSFHDTALDDYDIKRAAFCLSQSQTLMQGFESEFSAKTILGNRPSTTILINYFTPETLGALLALYEHKVFVKSVIWGINAFDQFGVEHGKTVAKTLTRCMMENHDMNELDSSTRGLLEKIMQRVKA